MSITSPTQQNLFDDPGDLPENPDYLTQQLITYIGNKRSLLGPIEDAVRTVRAELGGRRLVAFDGFSGSGVVARMFKRHASRVLSSDLEDYANVVARCYLSNRSEVPLSELSTFVEWMNAEVASGGTLPAEGFIQRLYSPVDDDNVRPGERVFYTSENGRRLDHYRQLIEAAPVALRDFLLGPLLSEASVHANTAGVFKGFYKDKVTGVGRFGGSGEDALIRIKGAISMRVPVLSDHESDLQVLGGDINEVVKCLDEEVDLAYFDPPYNQHPYGSNYFMLNLLVHYIAPSDISEVSGIPTDWRRSSYNVKKASHDKMRELIRDTPARYVLVSFNDEGFISPEDMRRMLADKGEVREVQLRYNAFRGSRNLSGRSTHVTEHLYLVKSR
jgi:adenine-specific DNA-methyltransferase